jgi:hypothetical protein
MQKMMDREASRQRCGRDLDSRAYSRQGDSLFPSRLRGSPHLSTRQYARIVDSWVNQLGLDRSSYGTHSLRAVQLLLGPTKLESTVRYLGIEVNDALEMAEQTEV